jgi:hypothetical protein
MEHNPTRVSADTPSVYLETPAESRISQWLDHWCTNRFRTLLTWVALNGIMVGLFFLGFFGALVDGVDGVSRSISRFVSVDPTVQDIWRCVAIAAVVSSFQPVLLRLNGLRTIVWITAFAVGLCAFHFLFMRPDTLNVTPLLLPFALPGVALIGCRTRPWMTLVGGILIVSATGEIAVTLNGFPRFKDYWLTPWALGFAPGVLYPAVVIFGTKLIGQMEREGETRISQQRRCTAQ